MICCLNWVMKDKQDVVRDKGFSRRMEQVTSRQLWIWGSKDFFLIRTEVMKH